MRAHGSDGTNVDNFKWFGACLGCAAADDNEDDDDGGDDDDDPVVVKYGQGDDHSDEAAKTS